MGFILLFWQMRSGREAITQTHRFPVALICECWRGTLDHSQTGNKGTLPNSYILQSSQATVPKINIERCVDNFELLMGMWFLHR